MSYQVEGHLLQEASANGRTIRFEPSPNQGGEIRPQFIIIHYTACSAEAARNAFLRSDQRKGTSAHLLVDTEGVVEQFVAFNRRAWHAGVSEWQGTHDLNSHSIGIEIVNAGYLQKMVNGQYTTWSGAVIPAEQVVEARHKNPHVPYQFWQAYSPAQLDRCAELVETLAGVYPIDDVLGHDDIAPDRKQDPGPAFPLNSIRGRALGRNTTERPLTTVFVEVDRLNVRSGPGVDYPLAGSPVRRGTALHVLRSQGDWLNVRVVDGWQTECWVKAAYTGT